MESTLIVYFSPRVLQKRSTKFRLLIGKIYTIDSQNYVYRLKNLNRLLQSVAGASCFHHVSLAVVAQWRSFARSWLVTATHAHFSCHTITWSYIHLNPLPTTLSGCSTIVCICTQTRFKWSSDTLHLWSSRSPFLSWSSGSEPRIAVLAEDLCRFRQLIQRVGGVQEIRFTSLAHCLKKMNAIKIARAPIRGT